MAKLGKVRIDAGQRTSRQKVVNINKLKVGPISYARWKWVMVAI